MTPKAKSRRGALTNKPPNVAPPPFAQPNPDVDGTRTTKRPLLTYDVPSTRSKIEAGRSTKAGATKARSLNDLPNEILSEIVSYLYVDPLPFPCFRTEQRKRNERCPLRIGNLGPCADVMAFRHTCRRTLVGAPLGDVHLVVENEKQLRSIPRLPLEYRQSVSRLRLQWNMNRLLWRKPKFTRNFHLVTTLLASLPNLVELQLPTASLICQHGEDENRPLDDPNDPQEYSYDAVDFGRETCSKLKAVRLSSDCYDCGFGLVKGLARYAPLEHIGMTNSQLMDPSAFKDFIKLFGEDKTEKLARLKTLQFAVDNSVDCLAILPTVADACPNLENLFIEPFASSVDSRHAPDIGLIKAFYDISTDRSNLDYNEMGQVVQNQFPPNPAPWETLLACFGRLRHLRSFDVGLCLGDIQFVQSSDDLIFIEDEWPISALNHVRKDYNVPHGLVSDLRLRDFLIEHARSKTIGTIVRDLTGTCQGLKQGALWSFPEFYSQLVEWRTTVNSDTLSRDISSLDEYTWVDNQRDEIDSSAEDEEEENDSEMASLCDGLEHMRDITNDATRTLGEAIDELLGRVSRA